MEVGMPLAARCLFISLSVPYQLKPGVEWPILGKWTAAEQKNKFKSYKQNSFNEIKIQNFCFQTLAIAIQNNASVR